MLTTSFFVLDGIGLKYANSYVYTIWTYLRGKLTNIRHIFSSHSECIFSLFQNVCCSFYCFLNGYTLLCYEIKVARSDGKLEIVSQIKNNW